MTIIVGVLCKQGLVIASDSQAGSFRGVHVKRLDYTKIYDVSLDGAPVVATGAGEAPFITRAIEIFQDMTREKKFHKPRELADVAEQVMTELHKRYIIERGKELGFLKAPPTKSSQWQDERTLGFAVMLGMSCGQEHCIYTVHSDGVAERAERYASLGSGSAFAEYLLARLYSDGLTLDQAVRVAVYVVEEVKKVDLHCGGPTQVVTVSSKGVDRKDDAALRTILKELDQADQAVVEFWRLISQGPNALQRLLDEHKKKQAPPSS